MNQREDQENERQHRLLPTCIRAGPRWPPASPGRPGWIPPCSWMPFIGREVHNSSEKRGIAMADTGKHSTMLPTPTGMP